MSTPRQTRKRNATTTVVTPSPVASTSSAKATPKAKAKQAEPASSKPDPSQLRSLALKTKKRKSTGGGEGGGSKKKKPAAVVPVPVVEEPTPEPEPAPPVDVADVDMARSTADQPAEPQVEIVEDAVPVDSREDGEISDEGGPPSSPPTPPLPPPAQDPAGLLGPIPTLVLPGMPPPTLLANGVAAPALPPHAFPPFPPSRPSSAASSSPSSHFGPPSLADARFPPPSSAFLEAVSAPPVKMVKSRKLKAKAGSLFSQTKAPARVDPVRDGATKLRITEDAYGEMRTLLLELLSWGVPPSYLVKSGLTRDAVLVLFADLKIRLPTNLPGPAPVYAMPESQPSAPPTSAPSSRPSSPPRPVSAAVRPVRGFPSSGPSRNSPAVRGGFSRGALASLPPPTLPGFGANSGRPAPMRYTSPPPRGHTTSGPELALLADIALPIAEPAAMPSPPPTMPPFPPTLNIGQASSSSDQPASDVISLISPVSNGDLALPLVPIDSAALISLEAQRRALLVSRKKALEDKRKATEEAAQATALRNAKGKGREVVEPDASEMMEDGELDDSGAASLIEMELEKIGLELAAGGMMDGVEEDEASSEGESAPDGLAEYDDDEEGQVFDPDGKIEDESNVLLAGLGTSDTGPSPAGEEGALESAPDSPVAGQAPLSLWLALPKLPAVQSDGIVGHPTDDSFGSSNPPQKKPSTSKRPVALDFDGRPTTTLPTIAPSTHHHKKRRALVPDRPKRFIIELSDSETDEDDSDSLPSPAIAGPSSIRGMGGHHSSAASTSALTLDLPRLPSGSMSDLDVEAKLKLEQKEAEIKKMTQLIAAMEAKQKSRTSKSTVSTPTLAAATPIPPPSDATPAESSAVTLGLGHGSREGSVEALQGAVEQLQVVKERMEEERDEFLEDLVGGGEPEQDEVIEEDTPLTVVADADPKGKARAKVSPAASDAGPEQSALPDMTYISPLAAYPSLQDPETPARPTRSSKKKKNAKSTVSATLTSAQLSTLRNSTIASRHLDPGRQLCRYEQAGGICADSSCQGAHWRDLEPSDDDLATFLLDLFPNETLDGVKTVVRAARTSDKPGSYSDVAQRAATLLHSRQ